MLTDTLEEDNDSLMELASEVRQLFRDTLRLNAKYKRVTINELSLVCFFLPTPEYTHFGYSNRMNVVLYVEYRRTLIIELPWAKKRVSTGALSVSFFPHLNTLILDTLIV